MATKGVSTVDVMSNQQFILWVCLITFEYLASTMFILSAFVSRMLVAITIISSEGRDDEVVRAV